MKKERKLMDHKRDHESINNRANIDTRICTCTMYG